MMEIVGIIFDLLVSAGLAASIFYSIKLHRDVKQLLDQKNELENFMRQVRDQIQTAERNFKSIQLASQESAGELEEDILRAKTITGELKFMLEAGESLAQRLANRAERTSEAVHEKPLLQDTAMPQKPAEKSKKSLSKAEQELAQRMAGIR